MQPTTHIHPKPTLNRAIHYGAMVAVVLLVLSAPLQVLLTLLGAPGGLFILSAFFTLILALPVLMLTAIAPAVTVSDEGITLKPTIWKTRFVSWSDVQAVKPFPLLPSPDSEINRKAGVGRKNYRPAEGIMLVIPSLPLQYRIGGFFAGERAAPIIALTNRAHTDYDKLVKTIGSHFKIETESSDK
ncbi:MAG: hypothetical protein H7Y09_13575 [Chitinophagaceae bacterium]|nr:hypothetical protein [Anaerolineae bacterium]